MTRKRTDNGTFERNNNGKAENAMDFTNQNFQRTKSISAEKKSKNNKRLSENSGIEEQEFVEDDVQGSVHDGDEQD